MITRSRCRTCGGTGTVDVVGGMRGHIIADMCPDCEDQWCWMFAHQALPHHLPDADCRKLRRELERNVA